MRAGVALGAVSLLLGGAASLAGDFADVVYPTGYHPGPGQFINEPSPFTGLIFNDQTKALGAPLGGGTSAPDNSKVVTLGGFGGSVILGFSATVLDDPCNAYGIDAIVYGNSFVVGPISNLGREPGVIEISRDANSNGLPDDAWYVIRAPMSGASGSGITSAVPNDQRVVRAWDNDPGTPTLPADPAWYPDAALYPWLVPPGFPSSYQTETFALLMPPAGAALVGHADVSSVLLLGDLDGDNTIDAPATAPEHFYTVPDNPWVFGVDAGSGGGDGFDIAWAVDAATGDAAHLGGFDFVRISSGIDVIQGALGEVSTEVGAVADARPEPAFFDIDGSSIVNVEDLYSWHATPIDVTGESSVDAVDERLVVWCVRAGEVADTEANR